MKLRVLITNHTLAARQGTELYVRDLATALLARGHTPVAFSTVLGDVARELRAATVPVIDRLERMAEPPDIIHGHHYPETLAALLHFPGVPAVYVCHNWAAWTDEPPKFPRVLRYVAVDHTCRDRLALEHGIPAEKLRVRLNFVDLSRFKPRPPLPARPRRALVFSNYASDETHLRPIREACARAGLELDAVGLGVGNASAEPEALLGNYEIVFAKGRAAIEAMAVGAAVVVCDAKGLGPMVTAAEFDRLRALNFGVRTLRGPLDPELIAREVARYDPRDAAEVSRRVRAVAGRELAVDGMVALYEEVIAEYAARGGDDARAEGRAAADYILRLKSQFNSEVAATARLRERLQRIPLVGRPGVRLARALLRRAARPQAQ
jgi:hypothetical protein